MFFFIYDILFVVNGGIMQKPDLTLARKRTKEEVKHINYKLDDKYKN